MVEFTLCDKTKQHRRSAKRAGAVLRFCGMFDLAPVVLRVEFLICGASLLALLIRLRVCGFKMPNEANLTECLHLDPDARIDQEGFKFAAAASFFLSRRPAPRMFDLGTFGGGSIGGDYDPPMEFIVHAYRNGVDMRMWW